MAILFSFTACCTFYTSFYTSLLCKCPRNTCFQPRLRPRIVESRSASHDVYPAWRIFLLAVSESVRPYGIPSRVAIVVILSLYTTKQQGTNYPKVTNIKVPSRGRHIVTNHNRPGSGLGAFICSRHCHMRPNIYPYQGRLC